MRAASSRLLPVLVALAFYAAFGKANAATTLLPANGARQVNPDTHLVLRFDRPPVLGDVGRSAFTTRHDRLVDTLDMSIPAGPTERTKLPAAPYLSTPYAMLTARVPQTPTPGRARRPRARNLAATTTSSPSSAASPMASTSIQ
jgi:pectinesterase